MSYNFYIHGEITVAHHSDCTDRGCAGCAPANAELERVAEHLKHCARHDTVWAISQDYDDPSSDTIGDYEFVVLTPLDDNRIEIDVRNLDAEKFDARATAIADIAVDMLDLVLGGRDNVEIEGEPVHKERVFPTLYELLRTHAEVKLRNSDHEIVIKR